MEAIFVELRACNPERNCSRAWRIAIDRDLFGELVADVTFGRIGKAGRTQRRHCSNENEAKALLKLGLMRRSTAKRRIGVDYVVTAYSALAIGYIKDCGLHIQWRS